MLQPRPEKSPMTRASTPGSLSTSTLIVCVSGFSSRFSNEYADPGWVITFIPFHGHALVRAILLFPFFAAKLEHAQCRRDHQDRGRAHEHRPVHMDAALA